MNNKITGGKSLNKTKGDRGEKIAAEFLQKIGYKIIKTKFRKGRNEIDIIAKSESGVLNFIEVKTRFESKFGKPYEAVDKNKLKKNNRSIKFFFDEFQYRQRKKFYKLRNCFD